MLDLVLPRGLRKHGDFHGTPWKSFILGVFPYKPSILMGYPPFVETPTCWRKRQDDFS